MGSAGRRSDDVATVGLIKAHEADVRTRAHVIRAATATMSVSPARATLHTVHTEHVAR